MRAVRGAEMTARSAELLHFVGLAGFERRLAGQLSGGMKQKLGLACALIHRPRLLLLDEPTTGVDPVTRQDFWQLIIRLLSEGVAVVVSTPYMDEAARCNRLGFMHHGRILMQGGPRELASLLAGRVLMLDCAAKAAGARGLPGRSRRRGRGGLRRPAAPAPARRRAARPVPTASLDRLTAALLAAGVQVDELRAIPPSLEDVFIALQEGIALAGAPGQDGTAPRRGISWLRSQCAPNT